MKIRVRWSWKYQLWIDIVRAKAYRYARANTYGPGMPDRPQWMVRDL